MSAKLSPEHRAAKQREYNRAYNRRDPERNRLRQRRYKLKHVYGITEADYDRMFTEQGGRCKLCRGEPNGRGELHVDHDHVTNRVRGLLCHSCNTALGLFKDSVEVMAKAIEYVKG